MNPAASNQHATHLESAGVIGGPYIGKNIISTDNKLSSKTIKISCNNFLSLPGRRVVLHDVLQDRVNAADCSAQQEEELAVLDVVNKVPAELGNECLLNER